MRVETPTEMTARPCLRARWPEARSIREDQHAPRRGQANAMTTATVVSPPSTIESDGLPCGSEVSNIRIDGNLGRDNVAGEVLD